MTLHEILDYKITWVDDKIHLLHKLDPQYPTAREFNTALELYLFIKDKILSKYTEELLLLKKLLSEV